MSPLLLGITLGAVGAFMLDPQHGRRRRALVRDKVTRGITEGRDFADAASQDLRSRARGLAAEVRGLRGPATSEAPQGSSTEADRESWALVQEDWSPGIRALGGGAGAAFLLYALARGGITGVGALVLGAALLGRASTNRPLASVARRRKLETA